METVTRGRGSPGCVRSVEIEGWVKGGGELWKGGDRWLVKCKPVALVVFVFSPSMCVLVWVGCCVRVCGDAGQKV